MRISLFIFPTTPETELKGNMRQEKNAAHSGSFKIIIIYLYLTIKDAIYLFHLHVESREE